MNELTIKDKFELAIPKEKIEFLKKFYEMKARAKVYEDEINVAGEMFLTQNGLLETGYEQDGFKITKTKDHERVMIDTQKLKEEGLYDLYAKKVNVKGHIKFSFGYDD